MVLYYYLNILKSSWVKKDSVVIDGNHPLAGRDLIFDLEVVEIK